MNNNDSIFDNVPVDEDTKIKKQAVISAGDYRVLYQKWVWDGIIAETLIFIEADVAEFTEKELESLAEKTGLVNKESSFTFSRDRDSFTFVNFNFENPM